MVRGRSQCTKIMSDFWHVRFKIRGALGPAMSVLFVTVSEGFPSCFLVNALTNILYSVYGSTQNTVK